MEERIMYVAVQSIAQVMADGLTLCETQCHLAKQTSTEVHYYLDTETVLWVCTTLLYKENAYIS
jgi:hypothetical protein